MSNELELKDIMATIKVAFKQRLAELIKIGSKGTVLMAVKNENLTEDYAVSTYKSALLDANEETKNFAPKVKQIFRGGVKKVIVIEYKTTFASIVNTVKELQWNWLICLDDMSNPESESVTTAQTDVVTYCKENKAFGLVYNQKADSIYVCSVNNPSAKLSDGTEIKGVELLPIVVGVIAGCPYSKSISYKVFTELASVKLPDIEYGQITLYNEEEGVRVASPVNTLTSTDDEFTEDMKSITIVEAMKRLEEDLVYAFRTGYKGKYKNDYDHQLLYMSAADYYFTQLVELGVLDGNYENSIDIDVSTQRALWKAQGKDVDEWSDQKVKETTYKNMFYPLLNVKFLDAIEGMEMTVEMF